MENRSVEINENLWGQGKQILWKVLVQTALVLLCNAKRDQLKVLYDKEHHLTATRHYRLCLTSTYSLVGDEERGFEYETTVSRHVVSQWDFRLKKWFPILHSSDPCAIVGVWSAITGDEVQTIAERIAEKARRIHDNHERLVNGR